MKIAVYSRKSVSTGRGDSVENQAEMCRRYIRERIPGGEDAEILVYEDEGFSGGDLERPQFQRMLARARAGELSAIVCYRLDRISRRVGDFAPLAEELMERGVSLICVREQFDTATPMGKAMMYIASVFAQLERETIAQRVRDNMRMLSRSGRWLGGPAPTGYRSQPQQEPGPGGGTRTFFRLAPEPGELETVAALFRKYLELGSLRGTALWLEGAGVKNRSGRPYSLPGVKDILRNPVYCAADTDAREYLLGLGAEVCFSPEECSSVRGLAAYNKRGGGKGGSRFDPSRWIVAPGLHPAVVSGADWIAVQRLLAQRAESNPSPVPRNLGGSLLSGRIFCGECGAPMTAKRRSGSPAVFDYICSAKLRHPGSCGCRNLNGPRADQAMWEALLARLPEELPEALPLLEGLAGRLEARAGLPASRQGLLEKKRREMEGLLAALAAAGGSAPVARRIGARMEELEQEMARLEKEPAGAGEGGETGPALPASLREALPLLDPLERRELAGLLVERAVWRRGRLRLLVRGDGKPAEKVSLPREGLSRR